MAGLPFYSLEIDKNGDVYKSEQQAEVVTSVTQDDVSKLTDLFVVSHGWNNDMADARQLYSGLFANIAAQIRANARLVERRFAIVGIFWPSKKFTDAELIPAGGVASLDDNGQDLNAAVLKNKLKSLKGTFDQPDDAALDRAQGLVDGIEDSPDKQREFVEIIRSLVPRQSNDTVEDASDRFFSRPATDILAALAAPPMLALAANGGGGAYAQGLDDTTARAPIFSDVFHGIKAAAWRLLNYATYYQMKERAGKVGGGINGVLRLVQQSRPDLRIHLIGHSFGARAVTAAVDGPASLRPSSLSLLQGAFSHNGFAEKFDGQIDGFFRKVISQSKVNGPIVVSHTINDRAVGIAYPIASRIAFDNLSALGDENDVYGGIGRNGAIKMRPGEFEKGVLLAETGIYRLTARKVYNLLADAFVKSHGDVTGPQVANAIVNAVGA